MTLAFKCIKCNAVHRSNDVDNAYAEHYDMADRKGVWQVYVRPFNPVLSAEGLYAYDQN